MQKYWNLLTECAKIAQEREEYYGNVEDNFTNIQEILRVAFWIEMSLEDITKVMIATKLSRNKNKFKEDNYVDMINYLAISLHLRDKDL